MFRGAIASTTAVSAAFILAGTASIAGAQEITDVGTGDAEVVALSNSIASVSPGDSQWVAVNWTSLHAEARELRVTAVGSEGVAVSYPTYPVDGTYSSGYQDDTLSVSEVDFTALKITVAEDAPAPLALKVTVSYVSDTGAHTQTIEMPFGAGGPVTGGGNSGGEACDELVIDSFQAAPYTFTFQVGNRSATEQSFRFVIPNADYKLDNLNHNGSGQDLELVHVEKGDGTYDITLTGTVPAYQSFGGQQNNGFQGQITPANDTPVVYCL